MGRGNLGEIGWHKVTKFERERIKIKVQEAKEKEKSETGEYIMEGTRKPRLFESCQTSEKRLESDSLTSNSTCQSKIEIIVHPQITLKKLYCTLITVMLTASQINFKN